MNPIKHHFQKPFRRQHRVLDNLQIRQAQTGEKNTEIQELLIRSAYDGTCQPALFHFPDGKTDVPMVVGLHTWSYSRSNQLEHYLPLCRKYGWALLLPEYRGPSLADNPDRRNACGSDAAIGDIAEAVHKVRSCYPVDRNRVFLLGCSGGGFAALLAAAKHPGIFRAVDVWCPVTDLVDWHRFSRENELGYHRHLEACLGGSPESLRSEYERRSPIGFAEALSELPLSLHHGKHDEIVPYSQSLKLALELERRGAKEFFFDFFDGEHEQKPELSFRWFAELAGEANFNTEITG